MSKVESQDLANQRAMIQARQTGAVVGPLDTDQYIRPFPYIEGYDYVPDAGHSHFAGEPQPGRTPQPHNINIMTDGQKIAIKHDFEVTVQSFEYSPTSTCSLNYPEVYNIRRTAVLK